VLHHEPVKPTGRVARFFGRDAALVRIDRSVDVGGRFHLLSQFFIRSRDFEALFSGEDPRDDANLRELISQRLALPTVRVQQHVGFEDMPAAVARQLGGPAGQPCFAMELRGFTVKDQPLFLQRVYGEPFTRATLVVDTAS
jgi:GntR family transcriptional regulator